MFTNVQILTEDEELVVARVEPDKKIILAYQNLRKVPHTLLEVYGRWVEVLDMSHNCLRELNDMDSALALHTLILDHNLVNEETVFPFMPRLRTLWLSSNLIMRLQDFVPLLSRACPNLRSLSLLGNRATPCAALGQAEEEQERYRRFVISHFKHLRHLDDKPVSRLERLSSDSSGRNSTLVDNVISYCQDLRAMLGIHVRKRTNGVV